MAGDWGQSNATRMQAALEALRLARTSQQQGRQALAGGLASANDRILEALKGRTQRKFETGERLGGETFARGLEDVRQRGQTALEAQRAANERTLAEESAARELARSREGYASAERVAGIYAGKRDEEQRVGRIDKAVTGFINRYAGLKMSGLGTDEIEAQITAYMRTAIKDFQLSPDDARDVEEAIRSWFVKKAAEEGKEGGGTPQPRPQPTPMPQPEPDVSGGFGMTVPAPAPAPTGTQAILDALEKLVPKGPKRGWLNTIRIDSRDGQLEPHSLEQLNDLIMNYAPHLAPSKPPMGGIHLRGLE